MLNKIQLKMKTKKILCGKIGHDLLTAMKKKGKDNLCPVANDFSRSWHNFSRFISPTFRVTAESYREQGGLD